jgi:predicted RNA-binding Zn-ribbon protein involved in translation (DUF1610 family)
MNTKTDHRPSAIIEANNAAGGDCVSRLVVPLRIPPLRPSEPRPETAFDCPKCAGTRMQVYKRGKREYPYRCNKCFGRGWINATKLPVKFA